MIPMAIDDIESLKRSFSQLLDEAEDHGVDRLGVAELLDEYADTVRDGYTELEPDRGQWYREVHEQTEIATDGGNTGGEE